MFEMFENDLLHNIFSYEKEFKHSFDILCLTSWSDSGLKTSNESKP